MSRLCVAVQGAAVVMAREFAGSVFGRRTSSATALRLLSPLTGSEMPSVTSRQQQQQQQQPLVVAVAPSSSSGRACIAAGSRYVGAIPHTRHTSQQTSSLHLWTAGQAAASGGPLAQQYRCFAAKGKGGGKTSPTPAAAAPKPKPAADPYAPPQWNMRRVPRGVKGGAAAPAAPEQRGLLQQLSPGVAPLRSLRQLGWPLGQQQVLGLLHDQLADVAGTNVSVVPFVLGSMYQSAASLAQVVKDYLAEGRGMPQVEQFLLTTIAGLPASEIPFEGIKVALKGRMSGKGGMTSRRVWTWGRTSTATLSDPVDYAHEAVITRAGYIGIKVWIRYKASHMEEQQQLSSRSSFSIPQLLSMPAPDMQPSLSSSAWWNTPGPLQPRQHCTHQAFVPSYDALTAAKRRTDRHYQQQQQHTSPLEDSAF